MHTKYVDLARDATCYREDAQDDDRRVSALWWCAPTLLFWLALIAWWLA